MTKSIDVQDERYYSFNFVCFCNDPHTVHLEVLPLKNDLNVVEVPWNYIFYGVHRNVGDGKPHIQACVLVKEKDIEFWLLHKRWYYTSDLSEGKKITIVMNEHENSITYPAHRTFKDCSCMNNKPREEDKIYFRGLVLTTEELKSELDDEIGLSNLLFKPDYEEGSDMQACVDYYYQVHDRFKRPVSHNDYKRYDLGKKYIQEFGYIFARSDINDADTDLLACAKASTQTEVKS